MLNLHWKNNSREKYKICIAHNPIIGNLQQQFSYSFLHIFSLKPSQKLLIHIIFILPLGQFQRISN